MSLVINTNVASLNAQRSLTASGAELKTAMERLSSGKKINSASDDAAGFAIAERMTAQIRGLNMAAKNANDGLSMLATIENATNDITGMLHRMRELAVQAINDTNGSQDRGYLQLEVNALMEEINRVANQTQYNGQTVLDGSLAEAGGNPGGQIQVGTEAGQSVGFSINSVDTDALALSTGGTSDIDVSDATNASDSLALITSAIEQVAGDRAAYGALQNRLEYTVSNLLNVAEYTTAARSRIADADFAAESARLAKAQVLQQSGTAMLAQANASSQLALSLFR
jgi:flagellin|tara:strand:- start:817 stop:1668 length:852 start_codon:yes stop_codon:yes gene_type:complete